MKNTWNFMMKIFSLILLCLNLYSFDLMYPEIKGTSQILESDTFAIGYNFITKQPNWSISLVTPENVIIKNDRDKYCEFIN